MSNFQNNNVEQDEPIENADTNGDTNENIKELGVVNSVGEFKSDILCLPIIGIIEGHTFGSPNEKTTKYEHIIPQLTSVEQNDDIKGLLIILNTVGGDVEAGLAIAELIATLSKPTVSLVLGGGHSIGIPLATAANYSFIAESATMILHPIRMTGMIIGAEPTYEYFRRMQDRIIDFIIRTSNADRDNILRLMNCTDNMSNDVGTVLFSKDAVKAGLMHEIGGLNKSLAKLYEMINERNKK
ncbi:ClpP family protease [Clostridium aminobutyricum]|uniref:ATP-dependent Clp protease proteolytic subunit n=1 Tax=Clostridium aminobutyricum TaxID=33953 RepID=A0A939D7V2_CLOAM|nr:ATP-dependent Clp protease proteolytic subunit [Clostridium aminobutyricum]MBN7772685.1 ATP-dependent Clp protease proteolytic subunit [Clostridium aminobutyricum]